MSRDSRSQNRSGKNLFGKVPFMLSLQVKAPFHRVFKSLLGILEDSTALAGNLGKISPDDGLQPFLESLIHKSIKTSSLPQLFPKHSQ